MKKFIVILFLLIALPVIAEETSGLLYDLSSENAPATGSINMTPKNRFSGYTKDDNYNKYPNLSNRVKYNTMSDYQRAQLMKPKSVKEISNTANFTRGTSDLPSALNQFSKMQTSEDMMHVNAIQNGVQNMYMNF